MISTNLPASLSLIAGPKLRLMLLEVYRIHLLGQESVNHLKNHHQSLPRHSKQESVSCWAMVIQSYAVNQLIAQMGCACWIVATPQVLAA